MFELVVTNLLVNKRGRRASHLPLPAPTPESSDILESQFKWNVSSVISQIICLLFLRQNYWMGLWESHDHYSHAHLLANLSCSTDRFRPYEASLGWGKGCVSFWDRLDRNSGFHGNRKRPLTHNGKTDVSTFSLLFFIRSFSILEVTRTCIKSRMSSNLKNHKR